jgi:catechol 2,3-dioxygenase-like lactoylglutathione lyase family enzyme
LGWLNYRKQTPKIKGNLIAGHFSTLFDGRGMRQIHLLPRIFVPLYTMLQFTKLKESHITVKNLRKAISFYQDLLGLRTQSYVKGKHAVFVAGSTMLVCHLVVAAEEGSEQSWQLQYPNQHIVLESRDGEYDANREALVDSGVTLVDEGVRESGRRMFFVHDPDGNLIEITEYNVWGD